MAHIKLCQIKHTPLPLQVYFQFEFEFEFEFTFEFEYTVMEAGLNRVKKYLAKYLFAPIYRRVVPTHTSYL